MAKGPYIIDTVYCTRCGWHKIHRDICQPHELENCKHYKELLRNMDTIPKDKRMILYKGAKK